jgi:pyrroline-5-carboxylate reductase
LVAQFLENGIMQTNLKIAFIGGGNMAQALISGLADKLIPANQIHVVDVHAETLRNVEKKWGVSTAAAAGAEVGAADVIVLAVKPQQMREVVATITPYIKQQLVLSIAAGIRAADLSRWLAGHSAIVRSMPNTPALVGLGITGLAALPAVTSAQKQMADAIMRAVGQTVWLEDETKIMVTKVVSFVCGEVIDSIFSVIDFPCIGLVERTQEMHQGAFSRT